MKNLSCLLSFLLLTIGTSALAKQETFACHTMCDPELTRACNMHQTYMKAHDWHTALTLLNKVINANFALEMSLLERAECYYELGAYKETIADCDRYQMLFPQYDQKKALEWKKKAQSRLKTQRGRVS